MRGSYLIEAELSRGFFAVLPGKLEAVIEAARNGFPKIEGTKVSNGNVEYQEIGNVAVISIDGGMYKKDMSAMCMNVISYPEIIKAIEKADASSTVDTTLFRVDTPGGHVDGAEEVAEAIESAKNKTVTLFENTGASGGIWIFTAADEVYAIKQTRLGSIGVVATFKNKEDDTDKIEMTSTNAPNKRCKLGEDCKERMQVTMDGYEGMFFERVEKNTGFDKEKIKTTFDSGGMIFAKEAKKAGFIKEITTFKKLISVLNENKGVNPSGFSASAKIENSKEGDSMEYTKEKFEALEASHAEALNTVDTKLIEENAKLEEAESVKKEVEAKLAKLQAKEKDLPQIAAMAAERLVGKETLIAMVSAETFNDAKIVMVDNMESNGAYGAGISDAEKEDAEKVALEERCDKLGVTFAD